MLWRLGLPCQHMLLPGSCDRVQFMFCRYPHTITITVLFWQWLLPLSCLMVRLLARKVHCQRQAMMCGKLPMKPQGKNSRRVKKYGFDSLEWGNVGRASRGWRIEEFSIGAEKVFNAAAPPSSLRPLIVRNSSYKSVNQ